MGWKESESDRNSVQCLMRSQRTVSTEPLCRDVRLQHQNDDNLSTVRLRVIVLGFEFR